MEEAVEPGGGPGGGTRLDRFTGDAFEKKVKITFAEGASLEDSAGLFNGSLGGDTMRAIDIFEGDEVDEADVKALVREAVALNED